MECIKPSEDPQSVPNLSRKFLSSKKEAVQLGEGTGLLFLLYQRDSFWTQAIINEQLVEVRGRRMIELGKKSLSGCRRSIREKSMTMESDQREAAADPCFR